MAALLVSYRRLPVSVPILLLALSTGIGAIALVSVRDEIAIGQQAQQQVRRQVPELRDRIVLDYVQNFGRQLVANAGGPRYPYSFSIANYREINAFALPGGPVWVHRGVMEVARRESQLAGVLAHEVAHIAQRHAADQLTKSVVANGLLGLLGAVLGNNGGAHTTRVAAGLLANGLFLRFSRDDEREADQVGAAIMHRAGWNAQGMVEFMQLLREKQGHDPGSVEVFFSTHPAPADRIQRLQQIVARLRGGRTDSARFREVRARLDRLAPAQRMPRAH